MRWFTQSILILVSSVSLTANPPTNWKRPTPEANRSILKRADAALNDHFELQGVTDSPTQKGQPGYDWDHRGPKNDKEWAWFLNRHRYFEDLYVAYQQTQDVRYIEKIFEILTDWIEEYKTPPSGMSFSSAWRPLEAARRVLESWDLIYLKLWNDPHFPEALQTPFLTALENHGDYLQAHHALYGNHLITEMLALLKLSLLLPEATNSASWHDYALDRLDKEYHKQFYPEGTHKELSSHYQRVVVLSFQELINLLENAGAFREIEIWRPRVAQMWAYFHAIQKPNGYAPLNNDSDIEDIAQLLVENRQNSAPKPTSTHYFPNAGQVIFRDDSKAESPLWAFFDIGPRGTDHQHEDFLHVSISLGVADILVDNGRYTYQPGPWRDYFQGPRSHNLLQIDGQESVHKPKESSGPLPGSGFIQSDKYTAAWGSAQFRDQWGSEIGTWQRSVVLLPKGELLVLDHVITFENRKVEGYWHTNPGTNLVFTKQGITLQKDNQALSVSQANSQGIPLKMTKESGKMPPFIQGWHSPRFNEKIEAPVLTYAATISQPTVFAWLFSSETDTTRLLSIRQESEQLSLRYSRNSETQSLTIELPTRHRAFILSNDSN